jgi:nucleotide-binding universal stress UspA family protein
MNKKLLCATDGSHSADKAVDYAVGLAGKTGAHLTFLTVNHVTSEDLARSVFWDSTMLNAAEDQLQGELHAAYAKAKSAGLKDIGCARAEGHNIAAAIVGFAEKNGYDHVITGSVGRTGVARMLLGSIAQDVIVKAHCPVTVVR